MNDSKIVESYGSTINLNNFSMILGDFSGYNGSLFRFIDDLTI
jgi:hypothetical protein